MQSHGSDGLISLHGLPVRPWRHGRSLPFPHSESPPPESVADVSVLSDDASSHQGEDAASFALSDMRHLMGDEFMTIHWPLLQGTPLGDEIMARGFRSRPAKHQPFSTLEDQVIMALHSQSCRHSQIALFLRRIPNSVAYRIRVVLRDKLKVNAGFEEYR